MTNDQWEQADRLETTLQAIESLQQTGILNVERAKGGVHETGSIKFLYGQPVEASAGTRSGIDAFEWLTIWGRCRHIFIARYPSEIAVSLPPVPVPENAPASPLALLTRFIQPVTEAALLEAPSMPTLPAPSRLLDGREALASIQRAGLSHLHIHVFLLVDGRCTPGDIVRLTSYPLRKIQQLLSDLEQVGLIKYPSRPGYSRSDR
jgi:hypothetical protein